MGCRPRGTDFAALHHGQIRGERGQRQVKDVEIRMAPGYGGAPHEAPPTVSDSCLLLGR